MGGSGGYSWHQTPAAQKARCGSEVAVEAKDEAKAQQWVAEAYAFDHQLGLLTHVLGETDARPSQAVRLRIKDLITIDMTGTAPADAEKRQGRTRHPGQRKIERYSVSISPELRGALEGGGEGQAEQRAAAATERRAAVE